jgi:hypothetical protein
MDQEILEVTDLGITIITTRLWVRQSMEKVYDVRYTTVKR